MGAIKALVGDPTFMGMLVAGIVFYVGLFIVRKKKG